MQNISPLFPSMINTFLVQPVQQEFTADFNIIKPWKSFSSRRHRGKSSGWKSKINKGDRVRWEGVGYVGALVVGVLGYRKWAEVFQEVVKNWVIGSRWKRSCSVTQEVVTGDTPASLPLQSFSTSGPRLAFSFSQQALCPFPFFVLPLSSTMFALTPARWHMLRSYEHADIPRLSSLG